MAILRLGEGFGELQLTQAEFLATEKLHQQELGNSAVAGAGQRIPASYSPAAEAALRTPDPSASNSTRDLHVAFNSAMGTTAADAEESHEVSISRPDEKPGYLLTLVSAAITGA